MGNFWRWNIISLSLTLYPLIIIVVTPKLNGFSPTHLKQALAQTPIYNTIADTMVQTIEAQFGLEGSLDTVSRTIKKTISSTYIQNKTDRLIDDSNSYLTGQSQELPVVSFKEVRQAVVTSNPVFARSLKAAEAAIKEQSPNFDPAEVSIQTSAFDPAAFINNDYSVKLPQKKLDQARMAYMIYQYSIPVLIGLFVLSFILLMLCCKGWAMKLKWLGINFLVCAITGALTALSLVLAWPEVTKEITIKVPDYAPITISIMEKVGNAVFANYFVYQYGSAAVLGLLGVLCLIASMIAKRRHTLANSSRVSPFMSPQV